MTRFILLLTHAAYGIARGTLPTRGDNRLQGHPQLVSGSKFSVPFVGGGAVARPRQILRTPVLAWCFWNEGHGLVQLLEPTHLCRVVRRTHHPPKHDFIDQTS